MSDTIYKREVSFLDSERNKFTIKCELTTRNGYLEFTASGDYGGGSGQCLDSIVPDNDYQKQLVELHSKWHLKQVSEDFQEELDSLLDDIDFKEDDRKGESLIAIYENDTDLYKYIATHFAFESYEIPIVMMFCDELALSENDLDDIIFERHERVTIQGIDYLAGTDSEMDEHWDESLENYIDECILHNFPEEFQCYFDREAWKSDAKYDGRANSLNFYDGNEIEYLYDGTYYYAYRQ